MNQLEKIHRRIKTVHFFLFTYGLFFLCFSSSSLCMLRFSYPPEATVLLAPDADCCKIFTDTECELLQRVPLASEAISRIGSTDPAAMLFDAAAAFEEGDPRADEVTKQSRKADFIGAWIGLNTSVNVDVNSGNCEIRVLFTLVFFFLFKAFF